MSTVYLGQTLDYAKIACLNTLFFLLQQLSFRIHKRMLLGTENTKLQEQRVVIKLNNLTLNFLVTSTDSLTRFNTNGITLRTLSLCTSSVKTQIIYY